MYVDRAKNSLGVGAGKALKSTKKAWKMYEAKYEAFIADLKIAKKL